MILESPHTLRPVATVTAGFVSCSGYKRRLSTTMRQTHVAGDKAFVDYSGKRVPIVDSSPTRAALTGGAMWRRRREGGMDRRDFLRLVAATVGSDSAGKFVLPTAATDGAAGLYSASAGLDLDVRAFGAAGDGKAIDTLAVNKAIADAASKVGGIVRFPSGTYVCLSIHLESFVALHLEPGAVILAATRPPLRGVGA
jgi:hypothetical protein